MFFNSLLSWVVPKSKVAREVVEVNEKKEKLKVYLLCFFPISIAVFTISFFRLVGHPYFLMDFETKKEKTIRKIVVFSGVLYFVFCGGSFFWGPGLFFSAFKKYIIQSGFLGIALSVLGIIKRDFLIDLIKKQKKKSIISLPVAVETQEKTPIDRVQIRSCAWEALKNFYTDHDSRIGHFSKASALEGSLGEQPISAGDIGDSAGEKDGDASKGENTMLESRSIDVQPDFVDTPKPMIFCLKISGVFKTLAVEVIVVAWKDYQRKDLDKEKELLTRGLVQCLERHGLHVLNKSKLENKGAGEKKKFNFWRWGKEKVGSFKKRLLFQGVKETLENIYCKQSLLCPRFF